MIERGAQKIGLRPSIETAKQISASRFFEFVPGIGMIAPKNIGRGLFNQFIKRGLAAKKGLERSGPAAGIFGERTRQREKR